MKVIRATDRAFEPASHEQPQNPGVWKRVLATRGELLDGRVQMINWAKLPAGSAFRAHYHEDMEEIFILTEGVAMMRSGSDEVSLSAGDAAIVPPREVHVMRNGSDHEVQYIVVGISSGQDGQTVVVE